MDELLKEVGNLVSENLMYVLLKGCTPIAVTRNKEQFTLIVLEEEDAEKVEVEHVGFMNHYGTQSITFLITDDEGHQYLRDYTISQVVKY